jgi:hypothetical protein
MPFTIVTLLLFASGTYPVQPWFIWAIVVSGILAIGSRVLYVAIYEEDERKEVLAEFRFFFEHATSAWSLGAGLAAAFTGFLFFYPIPYGFHHEFYIAVVTIYLGILGITLFVHAFYQRNAPIMNVERLLRLMTDDIKVRCSKGSRMWIAYPALNIGYYRGKRDNQLSVYENFRSAVNAALPNLEVNAHVITYPATLYKPLYETYVRMAEGANNGTQQSDLAVGCALEATKFLQYFGGSRSTALAPPNFPHHVAVFGDVVYMINSYGLPFYKAQTNSFVPLTVDGRGHSGLATLLAFRREDPILADEICHHLELLITTSKAS